MIFGEGQKKKVLVSATGVPLGVPKEDDGIPAFLRNGNKLPNMVRDELSDDWHRRENVKHAREGRILRAWSAKYNCVGHVLANRRTWSEIDDIEPFLRMDGYRKLESQAQAQLGDVIVYRDPRNGDFTHVGLIWGREIVEGDSQRSGITVLSKWGHSGEYFHYAEDVPHLLGRPNEFWSERTNYEQ